MKIKKVRKQEMVTKIVMINQNLKISKSYILLSSELTVSSCSVPALTAIIKVELSEYR